MMKSEAKGLGLDELVEIELDADGLLPELLTAALSGRVVHGELGHC